MRSDAGEIGNLDLICKYKQCQEVFTPKNSWHVYCSDKCRKKDWEDKHPRIKGAGATEKRLTGPGGNS